MPANPKNSLTTKLIVFAIAIAGIVFCGKIKLPFNDQNVTEQTQEIQLRKNLVAVDRSSLSHKFLPDPLGFNSKTPVETTSFTNASPTTTAKTETNKFSSKTAPSPYQLRLDDQKAWGSLPRSASLVSRSKNTRLTSGKVVLANSESPIVPGVDDPHLWFESQQFEVAIGVDDQPDDQSIAIGPTDPVKPAEFVEPAKSDGPSSVAELLAALPTEPIAAIGQTKPVPANAPLTSPGWTRPFAQITPPARTAARNWETGRY